jgi:hypothetical protein
MISGATVTITSPAQLSLAMTEDVFGGGTSWDVATVRSSGHSIEGGILSRTVIVCTHVAVFPQSSIAE